jgi:hypothetical protein
MKKRQACYTVKLIDFSNYDISLKRFNQLVQELLHNEVNKLLESKISVFSSLDTLESTINEISKSKTKLSDELNLVRMQVLSIQESL